MGRDFRFRISGIIFFIIFLLNLCVTKAGIDFVIKIFNEPDTLQIVISIVSGVFIFFASDSIGFIFSTFFQLIFNIFGGYNGVFEKNFGDLSKFIIEKYSKITITLPKDDEDYIKDFQMRLGKYNSEQLLVYFFWHCKNGATESIKQWVERRFNAYFAAYNSVIAIFFATLFSFLIILSNELLTFTTINWVILVFSLVFCISAIVSGEIAMKDAVRIIDIQVASFVDPRVIHLCGSFENVKIEKKAVKKVRIFYQKKPDIRKNL
jgi:hypothetical protein